jgi:hypothetical protein
MPNRFAAGCQCCGEAGNTFGSQGEAEVTWIARPCSVGTYANRIGVDITIQNLSDCTDYSFFGFVCGTCTRTFSNLNGTYYAPVIIEDTPGGRALAGGSSSFGQPIINQVLGQWWTGSPSCSSSPSDGGSGGYCEEPSAFAYFKVEALLDCDPTNGLQFWSTSHVYLYLCNEDGTSKAEPSSVTVAPGTLEPAKMRPDCCFPSTTSTPIGKCCNTSFLARLCGVDTQGTSADKFKYDWVTT